MIKTTNEGNVFTYESDNGRKVIVEQIGNDCYNVTCDNGQPFECGSLECAQEAIRLHLNAMPMKIFLNRFKGLVNQKGIAKAAGKSINYMSHVATGRRPSSDELNKAIEEALRELGKQLININII